MECDKYLEWLSLGLDGALTGAEEQELAKHLAVCPDCRAAEAQLAALQAGFDALEDVPAPEGFAQGVMDRIRTVETPKVIPLFKRPQFKALAGLAACLVLAAGLYGAARSQVPEGPAPLLRSTSQDADEDEIALYGDLSMARCVPEDPEAPIIAAYDGAFDVEAPQAKAVDRFSDRAILILERMPEGAEAFIPEEPGAVTVAYHAETGEEGYQWQTGDASEALAQIERLAIEQGMSAERSDAPEGTLYDLVLLEAAH